MDECGWKALCESAGGAVGGAGSVAPSFAQVLADFEKSTEARERELLTLDCMQLLSTRLLQCTVLYLVPVLPVYSYSTMVLSTSIRVNTFSALECNYEYTYGYVLVRCAIRLWLYALRVVASRGHCTRDWTSPLIDLLLVN